MKKFWEDRKECGSECESCIICEGGPLCCYHKATPEHHGCVRQRRPRNEECDGPEPAPAPTNQDVPGKEEGEEEMARKYVTDTIVDDAPQPVKNHVRLAYIAGIREGKRKEFDRGFAEGVRSGILEGQAQLADALKENNLLQMRLEASESGYQGVTASWNRATAERDAARAEVSRLEEDLGKCGVEMEKDRLEIERLRKDLQIAVGHSNCYCDECKALMKHWSPSRIRQGIAEGEKK